jgi:catechol 2,3-dioxygenase-like lactoylglutathione lyase family enzyme
MLFRSVLVCFLTLISIATVAQTGTGTLDHVRIVVRDIAAARSNYLNKLGFASPVPQPVVYPEGSAHDGALLDGHQFLEWISIIDRGKMVKARPWMVEFADKYEGAHSVGLKVESAEAVAARLKEHQVDAPLFKLVRKEGETPVLLVTPETPHLPEGAIFFVQYPPRKKPLEPVVQPNTAEQIQAVWLVVQNLKAATAEMEQLGFRRTRQLVSTVLGADAVEFASESGSIILLQPMGGVNAASSQFRRVRTAGMMGVSIAVKDISAARELLQKNTGRRFETHDGWYGKSLLIPADIANGTWIELVQR